MSRYTVKGSAELDDRIDADLARITEAAAPHCIAGILLGGYGRGEGTPFIHPNGSQSPFNDYDLVVVVETLDASVRQRFKALEKQLSSELGLPVDLYPYRRNGLLDCEFSLLNYELKYGHKVVWGEAHILDALPEYAADAIPLSEGSRLLLNRGKLLLDIKLRFSSPEPLNDEERIRFLKFISKVWLALGDCALLAGCTYDISYHVKRDRIASITAVPDHEAIIQGYLQAIELKNWGDYHAHLADTDIPREVERVREVFLRFFTWYRAQYSTRECSIAKAILLNLKWNGRPLPQHPRTYLYDTLQELLKDEPGEFRLREMMFCRDNYTERFYALQARFP
jgi:hypothetical protein